MLFIPIPFVLTLLLALLLFRLVKNHEKGNRTEIGFIALLCAYMLQSVFLGLRWGYGITAVLPLQIMLAGMIAGLAYLSFRSLTTDEEGLTFEKIWPHLVPVGLVAMLLFIRRDLAALAIIVIFLSYGIVLLCLARSGPDALIAARLDGVLRSYRALQITGLMLIGSVVVDILINLDFFWSNGRYSPAIIVATNIVTLLFLSVAAGVAYNAQSYGSDRAEPAQLPVSQPLAQVLTSAEHKAIVSELDALMREKQLYKDMELNLKRLAQRLRKPSRHVSEAVNRCRGNSVSVYVNDFRVEEACRLLRETDEPVTQIVFASGFLTKSNFNREFLRVTGMSPTAFRSQMRSSDVSVNAGKKAISQSDEII